MHPPEGFVCCDRCYEVQLSTVRSLCNLRVECPRGFFFQLYATVTMYVSCFKVFFEAARAQIYSETGGKLAGWSARSVISGSNSQASFFKGFQLGCGAL